MREKRTPGLREGDGTQDVGEQDDLADWMLLDTLLDSEHPGLWSVEELTRVMGDHITVTDSLTRLERDGLIWRLQQFAFPTRAAVRATQIHT
jgi:DNA-binding HxlR family transcriptional regulator